jgi:hypothetical protein
MLLIYLIISSNKFYLAQLINDDAMTRLINDWIMAWASLEKLSTHLNGWMRNLSERNKTEHGECLSHLLSRGRCWIGEKTPLRCQHNSNMEEKPQGVYLYIVVVAVYTYGSAVGLGKWCPGKKATTCCFPRPVSSHLPNHLNRHTHSTRSSLFS